MAQGNDDDFPFGDDTTQEIPIVDGGFDYADHDVTATISRAADQDSSTNVRPASPQAPGYTVLPSDAFAPKPTRKRRRVALVAASCVFALGVIIGGSFWIFADGDQSSGPVEAAPKPQTSAPVDPCPTRVEGNITTGRDAGGTDSSANVIKALNYAYYVKRDANAVSEFVQPAARHAVIPSIENMQQAIDALPKQTTHCLTITDLGGGLNRVDLVQFDPSPGGDRVTFHQMIQTTYENGKWLIVSNTAVE